MKKFALHWQILFALLAALLFGIFFKSHVHYVEWMGTLFMNGLKMIVVPLVFFSLISGMTKIGSGGNLGRIGLKTLLYYMTTSLIAIFIGLILVNLTKPGLGINLAGLEKGEIPDVEVTPLGDTILNIVPGNILEAMTSGNMLSIIFFALLFGFFITRIESQYCDTLENFFNASFEVMLKMTLFIIRFAPLGIFGIVAGVIAAEDNLLQLFFGLAKFTGTTIAGLLIHALVVLPIILYFVAGIDPLKHYKAMSTALLTAFSTASSNATLPLTMESMEHQAGASNRITSFTLPLGATVNMDGTALYELVVVGFVAQLAGQDLPIAQQFIVIVTALLSSIGTAGIPMASLVTMTIIFSAVGLPFEYIAFIIPIDRVLDMLRTSVNVLGDSVGTSVIASSEGEVLKTSLKKS